MADNAKPGSKALLMRGQKVADIESTGDPIVDVETCRQKLRELGLYEPTTKLQAMHRQAHGFAICALRIHDTLLQQERSYAGASPFVVNASFALEVYLKALTERFDGTFAGIHLLEKLLGNLPPAAQMAVKMQIPFVISQKELQQAYDLAAILRDLNNAFVDWRYMYEDGKQLKVQLPEVLYALRVLHAASHNAIVSRSNEMGRPI